MKKWFSVLSASLLAWVTAYATTYTGPTNLSKENLKEVEIHGPAQLNQIKAVSLSVMGPLQFNDLQVAQNTIVIGPVNNSQNGKFSELKITGAFEVKKVEAESLQVIGPVNADNLLVKKETVILGPLNAQNSKFENITVTADAVTLNNVEVNNIYVKKTGTSTKPVVTLSGKTVVSGSIQFESGNGTVVTQDSAVLKGHVVGGETSKK